MDDCVAAYTRLPGRRLLVSDGRCLSDLEAVGVAVNANYGTHIDSGDRDMGDCQRAPFGYVSFEQSGFPDPFRDTDLDYRLCSYALHLLWLWYTFGRNTDDTMRRMSLWAFCVLQLIALVR
jgi:hypothetical protein